MAIFLLVRGMNLCLSSFFFLNHFFLSFLPKEVHFSVCVCVCG